MRIGICDDDIEELDSIFKICRETLEQIKVEHQIHTFHCGEDLLQCDEEFELLILDIEMPGMDGISLKKKMHEKNWRTAVMFATNHQELVYDAFGLNVHAFVRKCFIEQQLPECITEFVKSVDPWIVLEEGIDSRDIKYIKAARNYTEVYVRDDSYRLIRKNIGDFEEELSNYGFVRIHKSYLVNLAWVTRMTDASAFIGEKELDVSERMRKDVMEKYHAFCRRKARFC